MHLSDFDYHLPKNLIAQKPADPRDSSKLMVVRDDNLELRTFLDLPGYLSKDDVLVVNDSKVVPARLFGRKETGGKVELLLIRKTGENTWECLLKGKNIRNGMRLIFGEHILEGSVKCRVEGGRYKVEFLSEDRPENIILEIGEMPIPPYIKEVLSDRERYQTVYASREGAVAAPTAGLHFTKELLSLLETRGVEVVPITLFVGPGTFQPVRVETITEHRMLPERYEISESSAERINCAAAEGRRVIAVGTTSVRTMESASAGNGVVAAGSGTTSLFITPGHAFNVIGGMITNFHLPKSTLLMLVSAFAGRERVLRSYEEAIERGYRFYSYGDAMFII